MMTANAVLASILLCLLYTWPDGSLRVNQPPYRAFRSAAALSQPPAGTERRRGTDRRQRGTGPLASVSLLGRRTMGRRGGDRNNLYVDRYHPALRWVCVGLLLLSGVDAFLTLSLLERGGEELNPLMRLLLDIDIGVFFYTKLGLTALGLAVLLTHCHFRWLRLVRVSQVLWLLFAGYAALIHYEIYLLYIAWAGSATAVMTTPIEILRIT